MYSKSAEHKPRSAPVSMEGVEVQHSSNHSSSLPSLLATCLLVIISGRKPLYVTTGGGHHLLPVVDCGVIHIFVLGFLSFAHCYILPTTYLTPPFSPSPALTRLTDFTYSSAVRVLLQNSSPVRLPNTATSDRQPQPNPTPFALASWLALVLNHPPLHLRSPPPPPHSLVRGPPPTAPPVPICDFLIVSATLTAAADSCAASPARPSILLSPSIPPLPPLSSMPLLSFKNPTYPSFCLSLPLTTPPPIRRPSSVL